MLCVRTTKLTLRACERICGARFNVPNPRDFEHVENVLHETFTASERRATMIAASPRYLSPGLLLRRVRLLHDRAVFFAHHEDGELGHGVEVVGVEARIVETAAQVGVAVFVETR